jgi:hypothetical protein
MSSVFWLIGHAQATEWMAVDQSSGGLGVVGCPLSWSVCCLWRSPFTRRRVREYAVNHLATLTNAEVEDYLLQLTQVWFVALPDVFR